MGKTLKIFSYKGSNVYIRFVYSRWYELLVAYKGGIYSHYMWLEKAHKTEKRLTLKEQEDAVIKELSIAATVLLENLIQENKYWSKLKNHSKKLWQKTKKVFPATQTQD